MAMIYFVLWAVFLLGIFLAVPVAVVMEKKKAGPRNTPSATTDELDEPKEEGVTFENDDAFGGGEALQEVGFDQDTFG